MKKRLMFLVCASLFVITALTGCHKKEVVRTVAEESIGVEFNKDVIQIPKDTYYREIYNFLFPKSEETKKLKEGMDFRCESLNGKFYATEVDKGLFTVKVEADEIHNSIGEPELTLPENLKFDYEIEVELDKNKETKKIKKDKVFVLPEMKACYRAEKVRKDNGLIKVQVAELSEMEFMSVISAFKTGEL